MVKHDSFINRKRPAVEGQVEELLGPASQLDELISGVLLPEDKLTNAEKQDEFHSETKHKPG